MVPLSKSFHNVVIFGQCFETTAEKIIIINKQTKKNN